MCRIRLSEQLKKKSAATALNQYSVRLSAHPNDLIVNLTELPDNRRLRRHLPNELVIVVFVILVCKLLFPKATRGFERISYRGALLSTLLHATVFVFTQFAECTSTDCK
jgi:hypothetical protein